MADEIILRFSVKDDGSPVIERVNEKLGQTKKQSEALVPGLEGARKSLTGFVSDNTATIAVLAAVTAALVSSYKEYARYAEQVRDLSLVTGQTAEATSRYIQVLDDYQITAEDATTSARFLKEKGLSPTIDTLIMLADKFKQIKDPAERLAFIQENLGRGGAKWVNILSQSTEELQKNAAQISKNLILNDQQIAQYEVSRLAIDNVSDAYQGWKVQLGQNIGLVIAYAQAEQRATEILKERGVVITWNTHQTQEYKDAVKAAMAEQLEAAKSNLAAGDSYDTLNSHIVTTTASYQDQLSSLFALQDGINGFREKSDELAQKQLDVQAAFAEGKIGSEEYESQMADLRTEVDANAQAMEAWAKKTIFSMVQARLAIDGLNSNEFGFLIALGEQMGIIDSETATMADGINKSMDNIDLSKPQEFSNLWQTILDKPASKTFVIEIITKGNTDLASQLANSQGGTITGDQGSILAGADANNSTGSTFRVPGFRTGGRFRVGGQGGIDSTMVQFMATPGELVSVRTPQTLAAEGGSSGGVTIMGDVYVTADNPREFANALEMFG